MGDLRTFEAPAHTLQACTVLHWRSTCFYAQAKELKMCQECILSHTDKSRTCLDSAAFNPQRVCNIRADA